MTEYGKNGTSLLPRMRTIMVILLGMNLMFGLVCSGISIAIAIGVAFSLRLFTGWSSFLPLVPSVAALPVLAALTIWVVRVMARVHRDDREALRLVNARMRSVNEFANGFFLLLVLLAIASWIYSGRIRMGWGGELIASWEGLLLLTGLVSRKLVIGLCDCETCTQ